MTILRCLIFTKLSSLDVEIFPLGTFFPVENFPEDKYFGKRSRRRIFKGVFRTQSNICHVAF